MAAKRPKNPKALAIVKGSSWVFGNWPFSRLVDSPNASSRSVEVRFQLLLKVIGMLLILAIVRDSNNGQTLRQTTAMPGLFCNLGLSRAAEEQSELSRVLTNEIQSFWWS